MSAQFVLKTSICHHSPRFDPDTFLICGHFHPEFKLDFVIMKSIWQPLPLRCDASKYSPSRCSLHIVSGRDGITTNRPSTAWQPLPQHTATWTLRSAAPPSPPVSPLSCLIKVVGPPFSPSPSSCAALSVQKISFSQLACERHQEPQYSACNLHFDVEMGCVTSSIGKHDTPSPLRSFSSIF